MRPMDDATFWFPLVLALKFNRLANRQIRNSRGEIYVMRNEYGVPAGESHDESLVPCIHIVICQYPIHYACIPHNQITRSGPKSGFDNSSRWRYVS